MPSLYALRRLPIALLVTALLCAGCAGTPPQPTPTPPPSATAIAAPTADSQAFQASVVAAVQATSTAITLAQTPTATASAFADLVPFHHQPTDLVGLMPRAWALEDTAAGFAFRPAIGDQISFTVTLTDTSKLPAGQAEQLTKALFDTLRQPDLVISEDHVAADGSGRLTLIGPESINIYAWARRIDRGLLTLRLVVPSERASQERSSIEQMLASIELSGDNLISVPCHSSFAQSQISDQEAWFLPQDQRGDLFDPILYYQGSVGFIASSIADFDGDGRQDLALLTTSSLDEGNQLYILVQSPDGTLAPPTCFSIAWLPQAMAAGDLNGDGRDDLVVAGQHPEIDLFLSADQGLFGARRALTSETDNTILLTVADLNSDGRADLAAIPWERPVVDLFLQQENGELAPVVSIPINRTSVDMLAVADVSSDGLPDMIQHSAQVDADLQVFLQQPDHTFSGSVEYRSSLRSRSMAVGDVTGDGRNDVALSIKNNVAGDRLLIFEQGAGGVLLERASYPVYAWPEAVEIADFDGDGRGDVALLHASERVLSLLLQQDDGTLAAGKLYINMSYQASAQAANVGDLNGDGRADIVVAGGGFTVFFGRAP